MKQAIKTFDKFHYHEDAEERIEGERHAGIVIKDKKILLIHRIKNGTEYWVFPGGHRRVGDAGEQTVEREILEETNITAKCREIAFQKENEFYYLCDWISGDRPQLMGEEKVKNSKENFYEPIWIDLNKVERFNILPDYAREFVIKKLFKK